MRAAHESLYSLVRRFLIANPTQKLGTLEELLRRRLTDGPFEKRLLDLEQGVNPSDIPVAHWRKQGPGQHCPECAESLYHCDFYEFPWLTHCPVHHCLLVKYCPKCKKRWPDINELSERSCPCCGRVKLNDWGARKRLALAELQPMNLLASFISAPIEEDFCELKGDFREIAYVYAPECMWRPIGMDSPLYPALQHERHPEISLQQLRELHVKIPDVFIKKSSLSPLQESLVPLDTVKDYSKKGSKLSVTGRILKYDFEAMRCILYWIQKHAPSRHISCIRSYRDLDTHFFLNHPPPCHFCMALSLWFYEVGTKKYPRRYTNEHEHYPVFTEQGLDRPLQVAPSAVKTKGGCYEISQSFNGWLYRRGLEVLFSHFLLFSLILSKLVLKSQKKVDGSNFMASQHNQGNRYLDCQYYGAIKQGRRLVYLC